MLRCSLNTTFEIWEETIQQKSNLGDYIMLFQGDTINIIIWLSSYLFIIII